MGLTNIANKKEILRKVINKNNKIDACPFLKLKSISHTLRNERRLHNFRLLH